MPGRHSRCVWTAKITLIFQIRFIMNKEIYTTGKLLAWRRWAMKVAANSDRDFRPPGTERLHTTVFSKELRRFLKPRNGIWQRVKEFLIGRRGFGRHTLLHIAEQTSPLVKEVLDLVGKIRSQLPPNSRVVSEHRMLSDSEEVYSMTIYCKKSLCDQFVFKFSLSENRLRIVIDAPTDFWLLYHISSKRHYMISSLA